MSTFNRTSRARQSASPSSEPTGMEKFTDYWRKVKEKGDRVEIFDSREALGIGHTKLWKFLVGERRLWRRYLSRTYGFNVRIGLFADKQDSATNESIPILEEPHAEGQLNAQDVLNRWSRRRQCLRHPFYQALEQYLTVCECLEECGDPPELLANPRFVHYPERRLVIAVNGVQHVKSSLLREMGPADTIPGETWGDYMERPHKRFRCRDVKGAFYSVYWPVISILQPGSGPQGDLDQFFGAFADNGISLSKAVRLKAALRLEGADPYDMKRRLLPAVVKNVILPQLQAISDPLEKEAAFRRLPGKAAYALEKALGATKKVKRPQIVQLNEKATAVSAKVEERAVREHLSEGRQASLSSFSDDELKTAKALLAKLPPRQREVYILHEASKLTLKEIAQHLGIAPGTVASHYHRAKAEIGKLRQN